RGTTKGLQDNARLLEARGHWKGVDGEGGVLLLIYFSKGGGVTSEEVDGISPLEAGSALLTREDSPDKEVPLALLCFLTIPVFRSLRTGGGTCIRDYDANFVRQKYKGMSS
ncbi:unnamed protein product, partial [Discosporangium mesarthrocarpum]